MTTNLPEDRPTSATDRETALLREIADLSAALDAIRTGGIDAVMIPAPEGEQIYTLTSADRPYRVIVEEMGEGAATITAGGHLLYANRRFAELARRERSALLGFDLSDVVRADAEVMRSLVTTPAGATTFAEVELVQPGGSTVPVLASVTGLDLEGVVVRCIVVADLSARAEADRIRAMMDSAMTGMALVSPEGRFTRVNAALCQFLGRDVERLLTLTWPEVTHPDDVESDRGLVEQLAAGTVPSFRTRERYLRPDRSVVWGDGAVSCVRNDDQSVKYFIAQIVDVTQRVLAERQLAQHEAELQAIAAGSADILVRTSADRRIEYISPAVARILGWEPAELLGLDASELLHPDDLEGAADRRAAGRALPKRARLRRKDGSYRWMGTTATPLGDPQTPAGVVTVVRDVEDLVRAEQALAESERHYRLLVEGAAEAMYESGSDHLVTWVSPAITALLGWAPDELIGTVMADLLEPGDRQRTDSERTLLFSGQATTQRHHTVRIRTKAGSFRWVSIWAEPVLDESGALVRTVGGIQDVHDLVTTRARLQATLDTEFDPHVVLEAVRDEAGQIVDFVYADANPAACADNQMAREDLVGARLLDLLPGHLHSEILDQYKAVVETAVPMRVYGFAYESELHGGAVRRYDIQAAKLEDGLSYTWRDVTDHFATAQALKDSEEIHRLLTENLSDVVVHVRDGILVWVSPSVTATLGWSPEDWLGHPALDFIEPAERSRFERDQAAILGGHLTLVRRRMRAKDGRFHWIQVHAKPYYDGDGRQDGIVAAFRVIDPEVAAEVDLETRARFDELTGLLNRREVLERVTVLTSHPRRTGEEAAVLFGDIDGFKTINDTYGHSAGDDVLQTVAARVNACLRSGDLAARIGGDELLVLLDGVHELANAVDIADNIRRAVAQPIRTDGLTLNTTLSIGVTLALPGEDVDEMIARADEAMYEAKQAGGDRVVPRMPNSNMPR